jgi:hypothetical protein
MAQKQVAKKIKIKCKWCTVRDLLRPLTVDGALKENTNYNRVGWFKSKQKKKPTKVTSLSTVGLCHQREKLYSNKTLNLN